LPEAPADPDTVAGQRGVGRRRPASAQVAFLADKETPRSA